MLVEWFGWRSIFFVVVPFCAASRCWLARRYLPIGAPGGAPVNRGGARIDLVGLRADRGRRADAAQRHGLPARRTRGHRPRAARLQRRGDRRLHPAPAARSARPLMDLRPVRRTARSPMGGIVAFIYGMGAVRLDLSAAGLHADARCDLPPSLRRRGAAAGRASCSRRRSRSPGRLADRLAASAAWSAAACVLLAAVVPADADGRPRHLAVADRRCGPCVGRIGLGFVMPSLNLGAMRGLPDALDLAGREHDQLHAPARRRGRHQPRRHRARVAPAGRADDAGARVPRDLRADRRDHRLRGARGAGAWRRRARGARATHV